MTDALRRGGADWKKNLDGAASAAGHEVRNALNGLLVNLEVVRSMAQSAGFAAEPFMTQAVSQSEESVRLAEAAIAMLKLVAGALGPDGQPVHVSADGRQISIEAGAGAERICAALQPLAERGVLAAESSGTTVILRIPEDSPK